MALVSFWRCLQSHVGLYKYPSLALVKASIYRWHNLDWQRLSLPKYPSLALAGASIRRWCNLDGIGPACPNTPLFWSSRVLKRKLFEEACSTDRKSSPYRNPSQKRKWGSVIQKPCLRNFFRCCPSSRRLPAAQFLNRQRRHQRIVKTCRMEARPLNHEAGS